MAGLAFPANWKLTPDEQKLIEAMKAVDFNRGYLAALDDVISGKISPDRIQRLRIDIQLGQAQMLSESLMAKCEPPRPKLDGN